MRMPARLPDPGGQKIFVPAQPVFLPRVPELRSLEGWYQAALYKFKVSCSFNDILRCAKTSHFLSCFRDADEYLGSNSGLSRWRGVDRGVHYIQPLRRCLDPNWAIIYTPDKRGDFLGRCFLRWVPTGTIYCSDYARTLIADHDHYQVGSIYGNGLTHNDIVNLVTGLHNHGCVFGVADDYL